MGDNALSILIQAEIDNKSSDRIESQLKTLQKNLNSIKISLDLGDIKSQFSKLFKEIANEAEKQQINATGKYKASKNKKIYTDYDDAIQGVKKLDAEFNTMLDKVKELGNIKSIKEVFSSSTNEVKQLNVEIETLENGVKQLKTIDIYKNVMPTETGELIDVYQLGDLKVRTQEVKEEFKKTTSSIQEAKKALNETITFTGTQEEAMRKVVIQSNALDSNLQHVRELVKGMGNLTNLTEQFSSADGSLVKMKATVEQVDGTLKQMKNIEVFRNINASTGEYEYTLGKVNVKTKEFGYTLEQLKTAGKGNPYNNLYESMVRFINGGENATKIANDLHNAIYFKNGNQKPFFAKLDTGIQEEYLKALKEAREKEIEMDEIHSQALVMNKQYETAKMDAIHKEALEMNKRYNQEQSRLQKEAEKLEKEHADRLKAIEQQKIKEEEAQNKKRVEQAKANMLEAIRLQEEEEKAKKDAIKKQDKQANIDLFKKNANAEIDNLLFSHDVSDAQIKALEKAMSSLTVESDNVSTKMKEIRDLIKTIANESVQLTKASVNMSSIEKEIIGLNEEFKKGKISLEDYANKLEELIYNSNGKLNQDFERNIDIDSQIKYMNDLRNAQSQIIKNHENEALLLQQKKTFYQQIESQIKKVENAIEGVSKYDKGTYTTLVKEYNELRNTVASSNITLKEARSRFQELGLQVNSFVTDVKNANKSTTGLFGSMKQLLGAYSLYDVFELGKRAISEMVSEVTKLDTALVELNKVADVSDAQLKAYTNTAFSVGESVGRMGSEVINATSDFVKMGYSLEEASKLAENALLYVNVGDLGSVDDATSTMISTMKAFGIEADNSLQIVDKINKISNEYAIDAKGIGAGLQRASSALAVANNDINQTLAMMAVGNQVVQDPESLANGLKTISMRIRGISEDGEELDSKMEDVFATYANGVKILNDDGSFRSTFDILNDLGKEWDKLSDKTKALLGEKIAGKNRANIFFALMQNAEDLDEALESSKNSVNSAIQENERYMESIDGRMKALKGAWQSFANTSIDNGLVKDVLSLTTSILKLADACGGLTPILLSLGAGFAVFKFTPIATGIGKLVTSINTFSLVANGATMSATALNTALSFGAVGIATAVIMGIGYALNYASKESERLAQSISETKDRIAEIKSEIEGLESVSTRTEAQNQRLDALNRELLIREKILAVQKEQQAQDEAGGATITRDGDVRQSSYASPYNTGELGTVSDNILKYRELQEEIDKLREKQSGLSEEDEKYIKLQNQINDKINDAREVGLTLSETLGSLKDKYKYLTDEQKQQYDALEKLANPSIVSIDKLTGDFDFSDIINKNKTALTNILSAQKSAKDGAIDYNAEAEKLGITVSELTYALEQLRKEQEANNDTENPVGNLQVDDLAEKFASTGSSVDILQTALQELNKTKTITQETVDDLLKKYPELQGKITDVASAYQALNQKIHENKFDDATQKIGDLTSILEDLQAGNGITASSFKKISSTFPELLAYMNDEASLTDAIKQKMNELKDGQNEAYRQMLMNSQSYYEQNIRGNEEMINSISKGITDLFNGLSTAYDGDLKNWTSLAQGKADVETQLINSLNDAWEKHFGTLRTQFSKMNTNSIIEKATFDREKYAQQYNLNESLPSAKLLIDKAEKDFYAQEDAWIAEQKKRLGMYNKVQTMFDDIKFDPVDIKVGGTKSATKNKSSSNPKASYVASIYQEIVDEILKGGEDIEKAMELAESKLKSAELKGDTTLQEKLKADLLSMQTSLRDKQASMAKELDVQLKEMAKILADTGLFKGYDINSLGEKQIAEVNQKLEKQINTATLSKNDKEVDRLNQIKSLISDIGSVYVDTLEQRRELSKIWWDEESARIEQVMEKIGDVYDKNKKKIDESNRQIELQQLLYKEGSERYIDLERRKYLNLISIQKEAQKALDEIRKIDKNLESEMAQEYLELWYDTEQEKREMIKSINDQIADYRKEQLEKQIDSMEEYKDAMEDVIDATVKMIKQEQEAKKKAIKDELDGYKEIIDAKKEAIKDEKDEKDYQSELKEKQDEITKIENKILELQNDNSLSAKKKRQEYEEELIKLKKELNDAQEEHSLDKQLDALDKEYDEFEKTQNEKIDAIDEYLDKEGQLRADAIKRIENDQRNLYKQLLEWNRKYGTAIDSDITNAWDKAMEGMETYGEGQNSVLETIERIVAELKKANDEIKLMNENSGFLTEEDIINGSFADSPNSDIPPSIAPEGDEYLKLREEVAQQMIENSKKWADSTPEERAQLHKDNQRLAKKIDAWYDDKDWSWYVMDNGKPKKLFDLYPSYHTGGIVGGNSEAKLKTTEQFAKLLKGETVSTEPQMKKFMEVTYPKMLGITQGQNLGGIQIDRFVDITVQGNLDTSVDLEGIIKKASQKAIDSLVNTLSLKGVKGRVI